MGIERVTPWPTYYANEPDAWDIPKLEAEADELWKIRAKDKFYLLLPITTGHRTSVIRLTTLRRRQVAQIIASATNAKAVFDQPTNHYKVGEWSVGLSFSITPLFSMDERENILPVLDALAQAGFELDEPIELRWRPPEDDRDSVFAISELIDRESVFFKELLKLKTELRFIVNEDTCTFDIALERLSSEAMNRVLLVIRRMILYVMETQKETKIRTFGDNRMIKHQA